MPPSLRVTVFDHYAYSRGGLSLSVDEPHVLQVLLDQKDSYINKLESTLSEDERLKAKRFYFEKDQKRYVISHGLLRKMICLYLNVKPKQLEISITTYLQPEAGHFSPLHNNYT